MIIQLKLKHVDASHNYMYLHTSSRSAKKGRSFTTPWN